MPWIKVALVTAPMMRGNFSTWCRYITLSIRKREEIGTAKLQKRLTIMSKRQPASGQRRGRTSFQISGIALVNICFGFDAVDLAVAALPAREPNGTEEDPIDRPIFKL